MEFEVLGDATGGPALRLDWRSFSYAGKFVMTNAGKAVCRDPDDDGPGEDGAEVGEEDAVREGEDGAANVGEGDATRDGEDGAAHVDQDGDATVGADGVGTDTAGADGMVTDTAGADGMVTDTDGTEPAVAAVAEDVVAAISFNEDRANETVVWLRYVTVRADRRGEGIGPRLAAFVAEHLLAAGYARVKIAVNNPFAYQALYKAGFGFTGERTGIAELVLARPSASRAANYARGLTAYRDRDLSDAETSFIEEKVGSDPPGVVDAPQPANAPDAA